MLAITLGDEYVLGYWLALQRVSTMSEVGGRSDPVFRSGWVTFQRYRMWNDLWTEGKFRSEKWERPGRRARVALWRTEGPKEERGEGSERS